MPLIQRLIHTCCSETQIQKVTLNIEVFAFQGVHNNVHNNQTWPANILRDKFINNGAMSFWFVNAIDSLVFVLNSREDSLNSSNFYNQDFQYNSITVNPNIFEEVACCI